MVQAALHRWKQYVKKIYCLFVDYFIQLVATEWISRWKKSLLDAHVDQGGKKTNVDNGISSIFHLFGMRREWGEEWGEERGEELSMVVN